MSVVGLSLEESGTFLLLPYIAPFGGVLLAGQVSDALNHHDHGPKRVIWGPSWGPEIRAKTCWGYGASY